MVRQGVSCAYEETAADPAACWIANRRQATEVLKRYLSLARRRGYQVSLAVIDIDHFKNVNDSYGHPAGDVVLQSVANLLTRTFREEDVVARWGGDEFAVVLYDTPPGTATSRLAQLLEKVASRRLVGLKLAKRVDESFHSDALCFTCME